MSQMAEPIKKYFPEIALARLVAKPGGKPRNEAIAAALNRIESLRDEGIHAIEEALCNAESVVGGARDGNLDWQQLIQIRDLANRLITLSSAFSYHQLNRAACSLGDLIGIMLSTGAGPADPVSTHLRTAWLFAPRGARLSGERAKACLDELGSLVAAFGAPGVENGE